MVLAFVTILSMQSAEAGTITVSNSQIAETGGISTVTITPSIAVDGEGVPVVLTATIGGGTATLDDDFTVTVIQGVELPTDDGTFVLTSDLDFNDPSSSTIKARITAVTDEAHESDETIPISADSSEHQDNFDDATVTIQDDDPPLPEVTIRRGTSPVDEGTSATFTLSRTGSTTEELDVDVTVTETGDMIRGSKPTRVTFDANDSTAVLTVRTDNDRIDEPNSVITATIDTDSDYDVGSDDSARVTVEDDDPAPTVTLSVSPSTIEAGESATVTASLSHGSSESTTVTVSATGPSGTYELSSNKRLTIAAEGTSSTRTVTIDGLCPSPGTKNVTVSASASNTQGLAGNPGNKTLRIECPVPLPEVTIRRGTSPVDEGTSATFTLSRTGSTTEELDVDVTVTETGDMIRGSKPTRVTFDANDSTAVLTVRTDNDRIDEPNSVITATIDTDSDYDVGSDDSARVTVEDDDPAPTVTLSVSPSTIEAGESATVTASLSHGSSESTTVTVSATGPSGTYELSSNKRLTIAAEGTSSTRTVTIDGLCPSPGTKNVTVSASASNTQGLAGNPGNKTLRIECPVPLPEVTIRRGTSPVDEGTSATFTLSRTGSTTEELDVDVTVTETGDMIRGSKPTRVTFDANDSTAVLTVRTDNDRIDEPNSVITATIDTDSDYDVGSDDSARVTVEDDDTRGVVVSPTALQIDEGSSKSYDVQLRSEPTGNVTVDVEVPDGADIGVSATRLTFTSGNWSHAQAVTVTAQVNDNEAEETFTITHAVDGGDYGSVTADSVAVTVVPVDMTSPMYWESSVNGSSLVLTYDEDLDTVSEPVAGVFTVTVEGSSRSVSDVSIRGRDVTLALSLAVRHGDVVTVSYAAPSSNPIQDLAGNDAVSLTNEAVVNNTPKPSVSLSADSITVIEDEGPALLTVRLSAASGKPVTVAYATSDGTATAGEDYTATESGELTFDAGVTERTISVSITADELYEDDETFTVTLSDPSGATLGATASAEVTIKDDDPEPSVSLSLAMVDVAENTAAGSVLLAVTLSAASGQRVTVNYATSDGTATAGSDYTAASGTLNIAPGDEQKTIPVEITDDTVYEGDETFTFTLSGPSNATLGDTASTEVTIEGRRGSAGGVAFGCYRHGA